MGLNGKGLIAGGASEMASVIRHHDLPPYWTEPVSASSEMDPLLSKAEPVSEAIDTSVITYLRKGKKCCAAAEKAVRKNVRNNIADPKVSEEGKEKVLQMPEQRFPYSLWGRPW